MEIYIRTIKTNINTIGSKVLACRTKHGSAQAYDLSNPHTLALHKLYRIERTTPRQKGYELLKNPRLNKGLAFSLKERHHLGIHGLLPPAFMTIQQQVYRVMKRIREQPDNLSKYIILDELQNRCERLFYRVLSENVKELMPIVYTPTVGLACQKFGSIFRRPKGVYITINDNSISKIYQILSNWPERNAIVVTDGERILGLGDLGANGMGIPIGKLALYVALAGVQPSWCLPVLIDAGTNNQKNLEDPLYIGIRRKRVRGEEYDQLIDNFMKAVSKRFGRGTLVQFEDFAFQNAYRLLDKYREDYCVFNDDIQGTAAVIVAGLIASTRITKKPLHEQKFLFHGAGADMNEMNNLMEIVKAVKPNGIIGVSTQGGAFTPEIIKEMSKNNERPIIFALSNPTIKAECTAKDAIEHSNGTVLFASGSPFDDVEFNGKHFQPGQGNNSYIFPGIGLSLVLWKARKVPEIVFLIAARTCAKMVSDKALHTYGRLYPRVENIRELSVQIAIDEMYVRHHVYSLDYYELINKAYRWPEQDSKPGYPVPKMSGQTTTEDE
ncbi:malic enzyme domain protein [Necator americanus]|uniref:Malic enzyme n=1 Tax=Necator americanus TaxID=51031 RepID=W2SSF5_NECAM|nr:malic enzyme domain protein [Necator americanus]ETN71637.1 malic enzyme domain protein [Necator americanus]